MGMLEARCKKCGGVCVPADETDLEHLVTDEGDPCGGELEITGEYFFR